MADGTSTCLLWTLALCLLLDVHAVYDKTIVSLPVDDIALPCYGNVGVPLTGVEWRRQDLNPESVLLFLYGHYDPINQHPTYKNRTRLHDRRIEFGDASLVLKAGTYKDNGRYECRVTHRRSDISSRSFLDSDPMSVITLRIIAVVRKEKIISLPVDNIFLPCCGDINIPITGVEWRRQDLSPQSVLLYRDGRYDPTNQHWMFTNRSKLWDTWIHKGMTALVLKAVTYRDSGTYECRITQSSADGSGRFFLNNDLTSVITLRFIRKVQNETIFAVHNGNVTLPCYGDIGVPITAVEWTRKDLSPEPVLLYRDGRYDPTNQHPMFKDHSELQDRGMEVGDVSLVLKAVTFRHEGTYECRVNQSGADGGQRSFLDGDIISVITLTLVREDMKIVVAEPGDTVVLPCINPLSKPAQSVEWTRMQPTFDHVLTYRDRRYHLQDQSPSFRNRVELKDRRMRDGDVSVVLKNLAFTDKGVYKCRIITGLTTSNYVSLHVSPPVDPHQNNADECGSSLMVALIVFSMLVIVTLATVETFKKCRRFEASPQPVFHLVNHIPRGPDADPGHQ